jgi:hypothetical protein
MLESNPFQKGFSHAKAQRRKEDRKEIKLNLSRGLNGFTS